MGKAARRKGSRVERLLKTHLEGLGYEAYRIPLSGAAAGFKGDVVAKKDGKVYFFEAKARKSEFTTIYQMYWKYNTDFLLRVSNKDGKLAKVSMVFDCLQESDQDAVFINEDEFCKQDPELIFPIKKLFTCQQWIQGCDYLVLKNDYQPMLFIKYI